MTTTKFMAGALDLAEAELRETESVLARELAARDARDRLYAPATDALAAKYGMNAVREGGAR